MSFAIQILTNSSPANKVDKEIDIDTPITATGTLRSGCSIIDPVIIVERGEGLDLEFIAHRNYLWIEEFKRYYYITNIISPYQGLWELHCHVDVLMSWKEQIRAQTAVVSRQESKYNLLLDDGIFMTYQNPIIQTKLFSVEAPFETQEFVLIVAGS